MTTKQILRTLEARRKEMAKVRDRLREIVDDIEDECARCEDAYDSLVYAIERLSETA